MKKITIACTPDFEKKLHGLLADGLADARICFEPGIYPVEKPFRLSEENHHLRFMAEGGRVRFVGGRILKNWKPADKLPEDSGLNPEAKKKILYCDLAEEGIGAPQPFSPRGFDCLISPSHSELFADGEPLNLSQYPRGGGFTAIDDVDHRYAHKDDISSSLGPLEEGFYCHDSRLKEWRVSDASQIWALGYWAYDWANTCEQVDTFDARTGKLLMKPPYGRYGYGTGQRLRFYNVPEEALCPGDYCLDFEHNRVFLYPKEGAGELILSMNREPFFFLDHSVGISFEGLDFEASCGHGVEAFFSERLHVSHCLFRNLGNYGVVITEGHDAVVEHCTIHDCGDGGIMVYGGNRCTLEAVRATCYNNHIYRIAKWTKCYQPAIFLCGVGMTAKHNLIHDCPHTGIMFWGNDMIIEDNEIYRVVLETGDAGAIYSGRDYTFRGNSVSHNYIHHLGGVGFGAMGIYNDDCLSGTKMCDNYLEHVFRGIMLGGGRDLVVRNNVFVRCDTGVQFDARGATLSMQWEPAHRKSLKPRFYRIERYPHADATTERNRDQRELHRGEWVSAMESECIRRYPELAEIHEIYRHQTGERVFIPPQAVIEYNVFASKVRLRYPDGWKSVQDAAGDRKVEPTPLAVAYLGDYSRDIRNKNIDGDLGDLRLNSNYQARPGDFCDLEWSELGIRKESEAAHYKYMDADFGAIGLVEPARRVNPPRVKTTIQFTRGAERLRVGFRNCRDEAVEGEMLLQASGDVRLGTERFTFRLAGGEERFYEAEVREAGQEAVIDAWSPLPGVRPARWCGVIELHQLCKEMQNEPESL